MFLFRQFDIESHISLSLSDKMIIQSYLKTKRQSMKLDLVNPFFVFVVNLHAFIAAPVRRATLALLRCREIFPAQRYTLVLLAKQYYGAWRLSGNSCPAR